MEENKSTTTSVGIPGTGPGFGIGSYYIPEEVVCIYKGKCTDEGYNCKTCKNNTGKRSHYIPDVSPYPYNPPPTPKPIEPYRWIPWFGDPPRIHQKPHLWCNYE